MDYTISTGRRKKSVARAYLQAGSGKITINGKDYKDYFPMDTYQAVVVQSLELTDCLDKYDITINVHGGGVTGQAEAIRHALARALVKENEEEFKPVLKELKLLTRDPRMVERKKPGQPKARKRFQFRKR